MIPSSLLGHVAHKIKVSLAPRAWSCAEVDNVVQSLISQLISDPEVGKSKKLAFETGEKLSRALVVPDNSAKPYSSLLSADFKSLLQVYDRYIETNHAVYEDITVHHTNIVKEDWTAVASNDSNLAVYADAANAMGSKVWVAECNKWFETFSLSYFRKGGAKKHFLKANREAATKQPPGSEGIPSVVDGLAKDLMCTADGTSRKIRLLDVGSCYNPLAKGEQAGQFEVTALDLYPVDPSVLQCDFLNLEIGPAGSEPMIAATSAAVSPSHHVDSASATELCAAVTDEPAQKRQKMHTADSQEDEVASAGSVVLMSCAGAEESEPQPSRKLLCLPAAGYDVVTMSLVLNYLPAPEQRLQMIQQARALLVSPPLLSRESTQQHHHQPHRNGLLLIAEKQSIFKPPFKLNQPPVAAATAAVGKTGQQKKAALNMSSSVTPPSATPSPTVEPDDWTSWVKCISSCGFELVKYHYFPSSDGRKSHLFAFCTVPLSAESASALAPTETAPAVGSSDPLCKMWIKQDRERNS